MKLIKLLAGFCLIVSNAIAQTKVIKPLKTGNPMPDLNFSMLNYKKASANISDFKNKILILDFWSPWCASCIAEFPKLYALQQQFKDSIIILPVGFQPFGENSVLHFITIRKATERELKLPTAVITVKDKRLDQLFPHQGLPCEIWIDKNGKFIAATDQYCVTADNIQKLLAGEKPYLPDVRINTSYNDQIPLLLNGNGGDENNFQYRSLLTRYIPGIKLPAYTIEDKNYTRLSVGNCTVVDFLKYALAGSLNLGGYNFGRDDANKITIVDTMRDDLRRAFWEDDVDIQSPDSIEKFNYQNLYNYDLMLPAGFKLKDAFNIMFSEMQQLFRVSADIKNKQIKCLSLIQINKDSAKNLQKPLLDSVDLADRDAMHYHVSDNQVDDLCLYLNIFMKKIPVVINKTGITQSINFDAFFDKNETAETLNLQLIRYGLKLVESTEYMDVLVIK